MKIRTEQDNQKDAKQYYHLMPPRVWRSGLEPQSYHSAFRISSTRHEEALAVRVLQRLICIRSWEGLPPTHLHLQHARSGYGGPRLERKPKSLLGEPFAGSASGCRNTRYVLHRGTNILLGNCNLIAGKKERNRNREPYKEGRVVGVVSAVVILATIIPALPVAGAVTPVGVVPLTPASVVPITPVIIAVVISATAGMNGGMTGMGGTSSRRSNSDDGYQDKAQCFYGFHCIYHSSVT